MHPELEAERAHVRRAYERLVELREKADAFAREHLADSRGGTRAARIEREARLSTGFRRMADLRRGALNLCFGRIDLVGGEAFHIGRVGISDADQEPLIVDWRAPVAEAFYRATAIEPLGLVRRRHLHTRGPEVLGIDDELFGDGQGDSAGERVDGGVGSELVLVGEAALLSALRARRTGRMGDIVATIQAEQDQVIRAALPGVLVVQGGPGTGKTAVALHRAAYLLYTHRFPLERQGVLVVGPNPVFLRYIEQVLPSLGEESACRMATPAQLVEGRAVDAVDTAVDAVRKGSLSMLTALSAAVAARQRALKDRVEIPLGRYRLEVAPAETEDIVEEVRALPGTHNERRAEVERRLLRSLLAQNTARVERSARLGEEAPPKRGRSELARELRRTVAYRRLLHEVWPALTPEDVVRDVLGEPSRAAWSAADVALLDEAGVLVGVVPGAAAAATPTAPSDHQIAVERVLADYLPECPTCHSELTFVARPANGKQWRCEHVECRAEWDMYEVLSDEKAQEVRSLLVHFGFDPDGTSHDDDDQRADNRRVYGHVVVDEAQDLSPMQWCVLARACPARSFTIVGDLGQASGAFAPEDWPSAIEGLGASSEPIVGELTINYRTPAEVMVLATAVLAEACPGLVPPAAVREAGTAPVFFQLDDDAAAHVARLAREEEVAVAEGKVGVIVPTEWRDLVAEAVGDHHTSGDVLEAPITVLTLDEAKGLEFDSVVVVEPADLVDEHPNGLRALYVALTRTTTRLVIAHRRALPGPLLAAAP